VGGNIMEKDYSIKYLKYCDDLYYNTGTSPISDTEYDEIKTYLRMQNPSDVYFQTVGAPVKSGKIKLPYILGSLNKVKYDGSTEKWMKEKLKTNDTLLASSKLDGVSIYVTYDKGEVVAASTRGDGYEGKDITDKAKVFCGRSTYSGRFEVRGEALLTGDTHESLGFKTRRNGVAGILNTDEDIDNRVQFIDAIYYELLSSDQGLPTTELGRFLRISEYGLGLPEHTLIEKEDATEEYLAEILGEYKNHAIYDIDGIVLAVNNSEREDVYYPEDKVAFKNSDGAVKTTVISVEWSVGRTGRVIPTVLVKPIEIQGVTISRATGFNAKYIQDHRIQKGTELYIQRAGDVIPHITEVIS
jgi:NAD-dependent DNA ligase